LKNFSKLFREPDDSKKILAGKSSGFLLSSVSVVTLKTPFLSFRHAKLRWKKGDPYSPAIFAGQIPIKMP
jgi:hypothetical protein